VEGWGVERATVNVLEIVTVRRADVRTPSSWADMNLDGDPILVVGRRPAPKKLEGFVVDLQIDTFGAMRGIARSTIDEITNCEPVEWHPNAGIEEGEEYFSVNVRELPSPPRSRRGSRDGLDSVEPSKDIPPDPYLHEAAGLLQVVLAPGELGNLHPALLEDGDFRFYAIVWEHGDAGRPVAFVSEYNPVQILRKAKYYFRFDGTLQLTATPDFTLNEQSDLVIASDEIAALRATVFDHLFSDIRALLNDVPVSLIALKKTFNRLPFSSESEKAVEIVCAARPTFARRLQELTLSEHGQDISLAKLHRALRRHGEEPTDFIRGGKIEITHDEVGPFLDVLEGRWYEADFTSEPRRAARWSRRKPRQVQQAEGADRT
jgi:hypothetical protein